MRVAAPLLLLAACTGPAAPPAPPLVPVPLPHARHGHRVEPVAGGLLAFGGFAPDAGDDAGRQTWWLAPGAEAWRRRADMGTSRAFFGSVVIDGDAYAIGEGVERYDLAGDRWVEVVPAGRLPRSHLAAAAVGREIFVLGGYPAERGGLLVVDVDAGAVRAAEPPPGFGLGDHFHFLAVIDGALHVVGGLDAESFTPRAEHQVREGGAWRSLPRPPDGLWAKFGGGVVLDGRLFAFGEFGGRVFEPGRPWRECAGWGDLVAMPALVASGGKVFCIGGMVAGGGARLLRTYDPALDVWRTVDG